VKAPNWVRIQCQHAHELMSARLDHAPMGLSERFKLWLHLRICAFCSRIDRQMSFMRDAMRRIDR